MKLPKNTKKYCPKCKKSTEQNIAQMKVKGRSATNPLSWGSNVRVRRRGLRRGYGNKGKYSKPAVTKFKRTGAKVTKKIIIKYTCSVCKKITQKNIGRAKKIEIQ